MKKYRPKKPKEVLKNITYNYKSYPNQSHKVFNQVVDSLGQTHLEPQAESK